MANTTVHDGLVRLSFLVQQALTEVAGRHGVTLQQLRLLQILSDRQPTMAHLAALMGLERSSLTGLVDRAQRAGLVERIGAQPDRRSVRVTLTPAGRTLQQTLHADTTARLDALTHALPVRDHPRLAALLTTITRPPDPD